MTRPVIEDVLVVTERPPWQDIGLSFELRLAKAHGARVHIVHLVPTEFFQGRQEMLGDTRAKQPWLDIKAIAGGSEKLIDASHVEEAIHALFAERTYDLVIAGAGQVSSSSLFCGSTGERLIAEAPCPVLILGPRVGASYELSPQLRRILYATDFSAAAVLAGHCATALAQEFQSHLTMLHVVEGVWRLAGQEKAQIKQPFREWMSEAVPEELPLWCGLDERVEFGRAANTIVQVAEDTNSDLIVMGFSGLEGVLIEALGETAREVIGHSPCPVLVVREGVVFRELPREQFETTEYSTHELVA